MRTFLPWGEAKCRFSHKITDEERNDANYVQARRKEKDEKASKCIHEFRSEGGCRNKDRCAFSHKISQEDRNNEILKDSIKEKLSVIRNKQEKKKELDQKVDTSVNITKDLAMLRKEFLQMKQMMMAARDP